MRDSTGDPPPVDDDEATDLPALRSWPAVYAFVLGTFVFWIVVLTALSRAFS